MNDSYVINNDTLVIMPVSSSITKVVECNDEVMIAKNIKKIIDDSCKYFGSSLLGRQDGSRFLLDCTYKLPIIVDNRQKIVFFPTLSPIKNDCMWISYNNIIKYFRCEHGVKVIFKNDVEIVLDLSFGSFENQYFRAIKLFTLIKCEV